MSKLEYAELNADRGLGLMRPELRIIRSGARSCSRCGTPDARHPWGTPDALQALCGSCHTSASHDRQAARQRAELSELRRRR